jgi:hypothetical protein
MTDTFFRIGRLVWTSIQLVCAIALAFLGLYFSLHGDYAHASYDAILFTLIILNNKGNRP